MTLYGLDLFDLNLTFPENNTTWTPPPPPSAKLLPQPGALIGQLTTKATISATTTARPTGFSFRPPARLPVVPHHHHGPRWGPYFEDGVENVNLTARVGSTVRLDCKIGMLQDKTVSFSNGYLLI